MLVDARDALAVEGGEHLTGAPFLRTVFHDLQNDGLFVAFAESDEGSGGFRQALDVHAPRAGALGEPVAHVGGGGEAHRR